jgi:NAD(P)-dependent dehydrogenase (short-subunit alcohol dehydrogenase family)
MTTKQTVLITGVSSGIGRATAQSLISRDFQVFGTTRSDDLTPPVPGLHMVRLDITDDAAVLAGVRSVLEQAGHLDGLINNAGYMLLGGLEETSVTEAQQQFDANVFGVVRMTNAVLPAMRARGRGRIVNVGSVYGFLPGPYTGIYAASKHAIAGYTETLDHEVRHFGIRAVLVEPSFTNSNLGSNGSVVDTPIDAYAEPRARVTRYPVGEAVRFRRLRRFVPAPMFDRSFRKRFQLDAAT